MARHDDDDDDDNDENSFCSHSVICQNSFFLIIKGFQKRKQKDFTITLFTPFVEFEPAVGILDAGSGHITMRTENITLYISASGREQKCLIGIDFFFCVYQY